MSETKLNTCKVFVPIKCSDELPEQQTFYLCKVTPNEYNTATTAEVFFYADQKRFSPPGNFDRFEKVTHWLKEKELYCFTKEELEKLLGEAFDAGQDRNRDEYENMLSGHPIDAINKEDYLKSILP